MQNATLQDTIEALEHSDTESQSPQFRQNMTNPFLFDVEDNNESVSDNNEFPAVEKVSVQTSTSTLDISASMATVNSPSIQSSTPTSNVPTQLPATLAATPLPPVPQRTAPKKMAPIQIPPSVSTAWKKPVVQQTAIDTNTELPPLPSPKPISSDQTSFSVEKIADEFSANTVPNPQDGRKMCTSGARPKHQDAGG